MKSLNPITRFAGLSIITLLAGAWGISDLWAVEPKPTAMQRRFASPDEAIKALQAATGAKDKGAMQEIFGAEVKELLTGDDVQDANNAQRFAAALALGCVSVKEGESKIILEIGTNNWPMPIPLVKTDADGKWHFDTPAGKDEIINRHIGKDELHAIGVCEAYGKAQKQYAGMMPKVGAEPTYAQKFKSSPGKKDGLFWPTADNEPASPFGPLVAEAHAEGYTKQSRGTGPHAFHGYCFKILTRQGKAAPGGKKTYLSDDALSAGFALVAYPVRWDQSGIMTFIVNQDGKIYQRNLGEKTSAAAIAMKEYNPDSAWTLVKDEGIANAVAEK